MLRSEGRQCKDCVLHNLSLHSILLSSEPSLSFGFCLDLHFPLVIYSTCTNWWAGLNRQWCRSRRWSSSAEGVFIHTVTSWSGVTFHKLSFWQTNAFLPMKVYPISSGILILPFFTTRCCTIILNSLNFIVSDDTLTVPRLVYVPGVVESCGIYLYISMLMVTVEDGDEDCWIQIWIWVCSSQSNGFWRSGLQRTNKIDSFCNSVAFFGVYEYIWIQ